MSVEDHGVNNRIETTPDDHEQGLRVRVYGDNNTVRARGGVTLRRCVIRIVGSNNIVTLADSCGGTFEIRVKTSGASVTIGESFSAMGAAIHVLEPARVVVGDDSMLARGTTVMVSDGCSIIDLETNERINSPRDVVIGDHVWTGVQALLLKGTKIGSGSMIGAGSVVTGEIPGSCVAAGSPAHVVRRNIVWTRELADEITMLTDTPMAEE